MTPGLTMYKILIVRLSSFGDIIHTHPAIYELKQNIPNCVIHWAVDSTFVDLVKLNPYVDKVIAIPMRDAKRYKITKLLSTLSRLFVDKLLGKSSYTHVIDMQGLLKSALVAKCFRGPVYGFSKESIKEKVACGFYTKCYNTGKNMLAVHKNKKLLSLILGSYNTNDSVNFGISLQNFQASDAIKQIVSRKNYVILFCISSRANKCLSNEIWAQLANYLIDTHNVEIVLPFGNALECAFVNQLKAMINHQAQVTVLDKTYPFYDMAHLIKGAKFVFGVDTGLTHLANALDRPLIAIYLTTNPGLTGIVTGVSAKNIGGIGYIPNANDLINAYTP